MMYDEHWQILLEVEDDATREEIESAVNEAFNDLRWNVVDDILGIMAEEG